MRWLLLVALGIAGGVVWRRRLDGYVDPPKPRFDRYQGWS